MNTNSYVPVRTRVKQKYKCFNCKHVFEFEPEVLPEETIHIPKPSCTKCNHIYLEWVNYQKYIEQFPGMYEFETKNVELPKVEKTLDEKNIEKQTT